VTAGVARAAAAATELRGLGCLGVELGFWASGDDEQERDETIQHAPIATLVRCGRLVPGLTIDGSAHRCTDALVIRTAFS
jgi:hypothetical protein